MTNEEIKLNDEDIVKITERVSESLADRTYRRLEVAKNEIKQEYRNYEENVFMTNIAKIICYSAIGLAGVIGISVIVNTLLKGALQ